MSNKIYNVKKVESLRASTGNDRIAGGIFYKGFNSKNIQQKFKSYDLELIKQDISNHFNIKKGEKLENPTFGTTIWSMIYEPMNDENKRIIEEDVKRIVQSDPRIKIKNLSTDATEQGIRIELDLQYIELDITEKMFLNFDKDNVPKS